MRNFKYLSLISLHTVLIMGLTGCGLDSKDKPSNNSPWSMGNIEFIRDGMENMDLRVANNAIESYKLTDQIQFYTPESPATSTTLSVKTICTLNFKELPAHEFSEPLKSYYSYFEFLPTEAITNTLSTPENPMRCSVRILLSHPSGSTHAFQLNSLPLILNPVEHSLALEKSKEPLYRKEANLFEVLFDQLPLYILPALESSTQTYHLQCPELKGEINYLPGTLRFDQFKLTPVDNSSDSTPNASTNAIQLCRIFALDQNSKISKMSDLFALKQASVAPLVQSMVQMEPLHTLNPNSANVVIGRYLISNPSAQTMYLNLVNNQKIQFTVVGDLGAGRRSGSIHERGVLISIAGPASQTIGESINFALESQQSATITVEAAARSFTCSGLPAIGTFIRTLDPKGIFINSINDITKDSSSQNTLTKTLMVEPNMRYGYYPIPYDPSWHGDNAPGPRPPPVVAPPTISAYNAACTAN